MQVDEQRLRFRDAMAKAPRGSGQHRNHGGSRRTLRYHRNSGLRSRHRYAALRDGGMY